MNVHVACSCFLLFSAKEPKNLAGGLRMKERTSSNFHVVTPIIVLHFTANCYEIECPLYLCNSPFPHLLRISSKYEKRKIKRGREKGKILSSPAGRANEMNFITQLESPLETCADEKLPILCFLLYVLFLFFFSSMSFLRRLSYVQQSLYLLLHVLTNDS